MLLLRWPPPPRVRDASAEGLVPAPLRGSWGSDKSGERSNDPNPRPPSLPLSKRPHYSPSTVRRLEGAGYLVFDSNGLSMCPCPYDQISIRMYNGCRSVELGEQTGDSS